MSCLRLARRCLPVATLVVLLSSCSRPTEEQVTELAGCGAVRVTGKIALAIEQQSVNRLHLNVPTAAKNQLSIEEKDLGLAIHSSADLPITGKLYCQQLTALHLAGQSEVAVSAQLSSLSDVRLYGHSALSVRKIFVEESSLRASASASLNVGMLDVDKLVVAASGESQLLLAGVAAQLGMEAIGKTQVDAGQLIVQHLKLHCLGDAKVVVAPSAHLTGNALGDCSVANLGSGDVSLLLEDQAILN